MLKQMAAKVNGLPVPGRGGSQLTPINTPFGAGPLFGAGLMTSPNQPTAGLQHVELLAALS